MPSPVCASAAGGGIFTASSAARDGMMAKAAMASAPMAAAESAMRLNGFRRMERSLVSVARNLRQFRAYDGGFTIAFAPGIPGDTAPGDVCYDDADTTA